MSCPLLVILLLHFFLLLTPSPSAAGPGITSGVAAAARLPGTRYKGGTTTAVMMNSFKPPGVGSEKTTTGFKFRGGEGVEECMPKGFRRSSAPSRYINYHTLGSSPACSSGEKKGKAP